MHERTLNAQKDLLCTHIGVTNDTLWHRTTASPEDVEKIWIALFLWKNIIFST